MGLCSLDQGAGGGARALPTRTLSREQHCSRIDVETQRACFRGCARDMPHARNGAVQSHMRCEAVRMHLAPVLLHGELKKLDWAHKWRRRSVRGCGKSHDHDDDARLSWASPWASWRWLWRTWRHAGLVGWRRWGRTTTNAWGGPNRVDFCLPLGVYVF